MKVAASRAFLSIAPQMNVDTPTQISRRDVSTSDKTGSAPPPATLRAGSTAAPKPHTVENRAPTVSLFDAQQPIVLSNLLELHAFVSLRAAGGTAPATIASSLSQEALQDEALRNATLAAMDGLPCMEAARKFHIDGDAKAVQTLMVEVATRKGEDVSAAGMSLKDAMEHLGITSGGLAERLLAKACKEPLPPRAPPAKRPDARAVPSAPDPDGVHVLRREPHAYRPPEAEAGLADACLRVAKGADYQTLAKERGYEVTNTDLDGMCTEYVALHDQAMYSARMAVLGGTSFPKAAERFHIVEEVDRCSLANYAAQEVGVPRIKAGERFTVVRNALGIPLGGTAEQKLIDAAW